MSVENPKTETGEQLYRYTYRDNNAAREIVFECEAHDILEADRLYTEKIGKDPRKQSHVGCSIKKIEAGAGRPLD